MSTTIDKPPCTHREDLPVRECRSCGAYLRTGNTSTTCDPCGTPPWEIVEVSDLWSVMADAPERRAGDVGDALQRIWEMTPA